uniref:Uncharacterized protein n=1 Tax=Anguilla anguilla TaxID=7936 RepID=A0A0E9U4E2_ANGAN
MQASCRLFSQSQSLHSSLTAVGIKVFFVPVVLAELWLVRSLTRKPLSFFSLPHVSTLSCFFTRSWISVRFPASFKCGRATQ